MLHLKVIFYFLQPDHRLLPFIKALLLPGIVSHLDLKKLDSFDAVDDALPDLVLLECMTTLTEHGVIRVQTANRQHAFMNWVQLQLFKVFMVLAEQEPVCTLEIHRL